MKTGGAIEDQNLIKGFSAYIKSAGGRKLPEAVSEKGKLHIMDTLAAMVSGSHLKPGKLAIRFIRTQGGTPEAQIIGTDFLSTVINAAMINGYLAHADETDDTHVPSRTHPGCAVVAAALAMAEKENASGEAFLRSVVLGYDISSRIGRVMKVGPSETQGHATHTVAPMFGATAAAASLAKLNQRQVCHALAYAGQQASGISSWPRDSEHIEKAFVFGGIGARNGITSAMFAKFGFTGEDDIFSGESNFLEVFCPNRVELPIWVENLGSHYEILATDIKKFSVGAWIIAAAEAMIKLVQEHMLTAGKVKRIEVYLPPRGSKVVNDRTMPDVNCQYIMAVILLDGQLTFQTAHDYNRMSDPIVRELQSRVYLTGDPQLSDKKQRPARVKIYLTNGQTLEKLVMAVRGSAENPMTRDEVEAKCLDLLKDVLGLERSHALIKAIRKLDQLKSVCELRQLLFP